MLKTASMLLMVMAGVITETTLAQNTWTIQTTPTPARDWMGFAYGSGKFVAVGDASGGGGGAAMTSTDGQTWTAQSSLADARWYGLVYGGGQFVATAILCDDANKLSNACIATSPDGVTWTARQAPSDGYWMHIAYGGGGSPLYVATGFKYCAGACSGGNKQIITSPDGITWTHRAAPVNAGWLGVVWGSDKWVALAKGNANNGVALPGNRVATSTDGVTWTSQTTPVDNSWNDVAYGNNVYVAVAETGTGNRVMTSPDGVTWTLRTSANPDKPWHCVRFANGLFVASAGHGGSGVMTSADGITWTSQTAAATNEWMAVAYGNSIWVAVSKSGTSRAATSDKMADAASKAAGKQKTGKGLKAIHKIKKEAKKEIKAAQKQAKKARRNMYQFSTVSTTGDALADASGTPYFGAVAVGTKVYFSPHSQANVGIFDTSTSVFSTATLNGDALVGGNKYTGIVAVGTKIFFAPYDQNNVGIFDTATSAFSTVTTNGIGSGENNKYGGAAAIGTKIFFAPSRELNVGIFETTTSVFSVAATNYVPDITYLQAGVNGGQQYRNNVFNGAAAVGTKVYFSPFHTNDVGIFDTTTSAFSTVKLTTADGSNINGITYPYWEPVAVGTKVFFTPNNGDNVGIFDTTTSAFSTVKTTGDAASGTFKYGGAAAIGTRVFFSPCNQNNVGIFDTTTSAFSTEATTVSGTMKYRGAAAIGTKGKVVFTPGTQKNVGILAGPPTSGNTASGDSSPATPGTGNDTTAGVLTGNGATSTDDGLGLVIGISVTAGVLVLFGCCLLFLVLVKKEQMQVTAETTENETVTMAVHSDDVIYTTVAKGFKCEPSEIELVKLGDRAIAEGHKFKDEDIKDGNKLLVKLLKRTRAEEAPETTMELGSLGKDAPSAPISVSPWQPTPEVGTDKVSIGVDPEEASSTAQPVDGNEVGDPPTACP